MSLNGFWKSALGAAALAMACGAQAAPKGIAVTVEPEKHALGQDEDAVVRVTLTNTSDRPQYVLKWRTPFEGVDAPLFEVSRDGEEREILSGAGFVASYLKEGSLDHLIAQVLRRELDQRLDVPPQQTVDQRQDIDRDRDPGLTL